jgi:hypothetical protein
MDEPFSREEDLNDLERHIDDYEGDSDVSGFDEPPDDFGWDVEWIEEPSPEERWDDYLNREPEADRLQQLMDALGVLRCHRAELLQALFHVRNAHTYGSARRSHLLERAEVIARAQECVTVSTGDNFSNDNWVQLQDLLGRYLEHLRLEAERAKWNPDRARTRGLIALMCMVHRWTGDFQYQLLSELLCLFVDNKLTYDNLRQIAKRADLPTQMAARPKLPRREKVTQGREAGRSENAFKGWGQSKTDYEDM